MSDEFVPSKTSYCSGKIEHLAVLKKLLLCAIISDRGEDAKKLYNFIAKTRIATKELQTFLRFTLELIERRGPGTSLDPSVLRTLHSLSQKLPSQAVLICEEVTNYYVQAAKHSEGYENLAGYLSTSPYNSAPTLFGYAGWLCIQLAEQDRRPAVKERHLRRALGHFGEYLELVKDYHVEVLFVRHFLECSVALGRHREARRSLKTLCQSFPHNSQLHYLYFEFLVRHFPHDDTEIDLVIDSLLSLGHLTGFLESAEHLERHLILKLTQFRDKAPDLSQYSRYMRQLAELLVVRFASGGAAVRTRTLHRLSALKAQFSFCGLDASFRGIIGRCKEIAMILFPKPGSSVQ